MRRERCQAPYIPYILRYDSSASIEMESLQQTLATLFLNAVSSGSDRRLVIVLQGALQVRSPLPDRRQYFIVAHELVDGAIMTQQGFLRLHGA